MHYPRVIFERDSSTDDLVPKLTSDAREVMKKKPAMNSAWSAWQRLHVGLEVLRIFLMAYAFVKIYQLIW